MGYYAYEDVAFKGKTKRQMGAVHTSLSGVLDGFPHHDSYEWKPEPKLGVLGTVSKSSVF